MKTLLAAIAAVLLVAGTGRAQCGQTKVFVTNTGFQNSRVVFNNNGYGHNNAAVVVKQTGFSDVAAVNGVVVVPAQVNNGYGHGYNSAVIVPQSAFFFAGSNPNVFEFRTREFLQVPGTDQIVTTDSFGNEIILNAGVRGGTVIQSRGSQLFRR